MIKKALALLVFCFIATNTINANDPKVLFFNGFKIKKKKTKRKPLFKPWKERTQQDKDEILTFIGIALGITAIAFLVHWSSKQKWDRETWSYKDYTGQWHHCESYVKGGKYYSGCDGDIDFVSSV